VPVEMPYIDNLSLSMAVTSLRNLALSRYRRVTFLTKQRCYMRCVGFRSHPQRGPFLCFPAAVFCTFVSAFMRIADWKNMVGFRVNCTV
jgi:hypothetical protein